MSRLPALKSSEVIKAILRAGFIEHRQRGSHKIFKKGSLRVTVPVHSNKDLKIGMLGSIMKIARISEDEL